MPNIKVEIFSVGKWNGYNFTQDDIDDIAANFEKLRDEHSVPLKFGHNDEQPITDGQPALGWVDKVWVEGKKLIALFSDVPPIVKKAFDKKLYRQVSIELLFDVQHNGEKFKNVLDAVALLGADRPAVSNLADLGSLFSIRGSLESKKMMMFSSVTGNLNEVHNMPTLETVQAELLEANKKIAANAEREVKFKADNEALKKKANDRDVEDAKVAAETKRTEVKAVFDAAVKSEKILPAQREAQYKLLNIEDDTAVIAIDIEAVKASINTDAGTNFSKEDAHGKGKKDARELDNAGEELNRLARVSMSTNPNLSYNDAFIQTLGSNKELAAEYNEGAFEKGGDE